MSSETNTTFAAVMKKDVRILAVHTEPSLFEVEIQQIDERDKGTKTSHYEHTMVKS